MPKKLLEKKPVRFALEMVELYFAKNISRSAAELAYFLILSFFPLLICINSFISLLPIDLDELLDAAAPLLPHSIREILGEYAGYITSNQSAALLIAGIFMTVFFASAAFRALMNIMEEIYGRKGYRGLRQVSPILLKESTISRRRASYSSAISATTSSQPVIAAMAAYCDVVGAHIMAY